MLPGLITAFSRYGRHLLWVQSVEDGACTVCSGDKVLDERINNAHELQTREIIHLLAEQAHVVCSTTLRHHLLWDL